MPRAEPFSVWASGATPSGEAARIRAISRVASYIKPFASKENTGADPIIVPGLTGEAVRSLAAIMRQADAPPSAHSGLQLKLFRIHDSISAVTRAATEEARLWRA
jgi:hypothetical protein